jgi:cytochrome b subunit of formate dehydrogenase
MERELSAQQDKLWAFMILPIVVLFMGGAAIYAVYFALAAARPDVAASIPVGQVTFAVYIFIAVVEWIIAFTVIRKLKPAGGSALDLIAPQGNTW